MYRKWTSVTLHRKCWCSPQLVRKIPSSQELVVAAPLQCLAPFPFRYISESLFAILQNITHTHIPTLTDKIFKCSKRHFYTYHTLRKFMFIWFQYISQRFESSSSAIWSQSIAPEFTSPRKRLRMSPPGKEKEIPTQFGASRSYRINNA